MANIKDLLKINGYGVAHSILSKAGELGERDGIEVYAVGGFVRDPVSYTHLRAHET